MKKLFTISLTSIALLLSLNTNAQVCFASAYNYTGSDAYSVFSADFNGDGKMDLAIANGNNNVSVRYGVGTSGIFGSSGNYAIAGVTAVSVFSADFNGDGTMDLVTANGGSNNVSVLLGDTFWGFASATTFAVGSTPGSVFSADFNGDGKMDLVTANFDSDNVSVLIGDGLGGFAPAINFAVGASPGSVFSADFNGDGKMDLVTAGWSDNVSVLIGDGLGGFAPATNYTVTSPFSVFSADFNGDGKMDLVTANYLSSNISVLIGDGLGGFAPATNFAVGTYPESVFSADFNGDGKMDLATANGGSNNVSVLIGDGLGGFSSATNFAVGTNPKSVFSADFNADGKMDLVTANYNSSNNVSVLLNIRPTVSTTLNANVITADQTGSTYQWFNCSTGNPIMGEINQSYTAAANGDYKVAITLNGCTDTSSCVNVTGVGIETSNVSNNYNIYSNNKNLVVKSNDFRDYNLTVYNLSGQVVFNKTTNGNDESTLNVSSGMYIVNVNDGTESFNKKVVIQ